jgi:hypothetical protein
VLSDIDERKVSQAEEDFQRGVRILAACETPSAPHGTNHWVGALAHVAVYGVPLSRQSVSDHWRAGTRSLGGWRRPPCSCLCAPTAS